MDRPIFRFMQSPLAPVGVGVAYLGLAELSLAFASGTHGVAMVWPPSGLMLAALAVVPAAHIWRFLLAGGIASLIANHLTGGVIGEAMGYTLANVVEALVATSIMRMRGGCRLSFVNPAGLGRFCMAAVLAAFCGASIATATTSVPDYSFFLSWFATVLLGMLLVAPLLLTTIELFGERVLQVRATRHPVEAVAMIALVAAVSVGTFAQSSYPSTYIPMIAMLVTVFRLGALGATVSVTVVAVVASIAVSQGTGPQQLLKGGLHVQVLFLQMYLLALFGSALPLANLLAMRDRLAADLRMKVQLLNQAEHAAGIGHWRFDPEATTVYWSPEVYRIHGRPCGREPTLDEALTAYHPDDRDRVTAMVEQAVATGLPFEFVARIVRADGATRHVLSRGESYATGGGDATGLFGVLQDITDRVEAEQALRTAREVAEQAARQAITIAETDPLTGLANRRKTLQLIESCMAGARARDRALSIAIFDIDHFKAVNDTWGHAAGDEVLRRVANAAQAALRGTDIVGRFGGEEFVLVLPKAPAQRALQIVERVRLAIEASGNPAVTASFGVATFGGEDTAEALLRRADEALYAAKRAGRNRFRVAA